MSVGSFRRDVRTGIRGSSFLHTAKDIYLTVLAGLPWSPGHL